MHSASAMVLLLMFIVQRRAQRQRNASAARITAQPAAASRHAAAGAAAPVLRPGRRRPTSPAQLPAAARLVLLLGSSVFLSTSDGLLARCGRWWWPARRIARPHAPWLPPPVAQRGRASAKVQPSRCAPTQPQAVQQRRDAARGRPERRWPGRLRRYEVPQRRLRRVRIARCCIGTGRPASTGAALRRCSAARPGQRR